MHDMLYMDRKPGVEPFEAAVNRANHMGWTEFDPALSWVHVGVRRKQTQTIILKSCEVVIVLSINWPDFFWCVCVHAGGRVASVNL